MGRDAAGPLWVGPRADQMSNTWRATLPSWWWIARSATRSGDSGAEIEAVLEGYRAAVLNGDERTELLVRMYFIQSGHQVTSLYFQRLAALAETASAGERALFHTLRAGAHFRHSLDLPACRADLVHAIQKAQAVGDSFLNSVVGDVLIAYNIAVGAYGAAIQAVEWAFGSDGEPAEDSFTRVLREVNLALIATGSGDFEEVQRRLVTADRLLFAPHVANDPILRKMQWCRSMSGGGVFRGLDLRVNDDLRHRLLVAVLRQSEEPPPQLPVSFWHYLRADFLDSITALPTASATLKAIDTLSCTAPVSTLTVGVDEVVGLAELLAPGEYDKIIRGVARRLVRSCGPERILGRVSETRFVVLDVGSTTSELVTLAERIRTTLARPLHADVGRRFVLGAAVVISPPRPDLPQAHSSEPWAEASLVLDSGAGGVVILGEASTRERTLRAELTQELRARSRRQTEPLHVQPIVDVITGRAVAAEALLRWESPRFGRLSPAEVLGNLSPDDLRRHELDMLDEVLSFLAPLRAIDSDFCLHVNFTAQILGSIDLAKEIAVRCDRSEVPPAALRVELTETTMLDLGGAAQRTVDALRRIGVRSVLDDFGVGYSNLNYLTRLGDVDIKIDGSFIRDLDGPHRRQSEAVCRMIMNVAGGLNAPVIAEHVETLRQGAIMASLGCHLHQGFHYSPAVPVSALADLLRHPPRRWREALGAPVGGRNRRTELVGVAAESAIGVDIGQDRGHGQSRTHEESGATSATHAAQR